MFSEALRVMDHNTEVYMVEQLQKKQAELETKNEKTETGNERTECQKY